MASLTTFKSLAERYRAQRADLATRPPRKPVWNALLYEHDAPVNLPQATWGHVSRYIDDPKPRGPRGVYDIPAENVRAFARKCRDGGRIDVLEGRVVVTAGAPVILDWEAYEDPSRMGEAGRGLTKKDVADIFSGYVRTFRSEWPEALIGVYPQGGLGPGPSTNEGWASGLTADEVRTAWQPDVVSAALVAESDFLNPSPYLQGPDWVDRDIAAYANQLWLMRARYPDKLLYPMVTTHYMVDESIPYPEGVARRFRDEMLKPSHGLMVWSYYGREYADRGTN